MRWCRFCIKGWKYVLIVQWYNLMDFTETADWHDESWGKAFTFIHVHTWNYQLPRALIHMRDHTHHKSNPACLCVKGISCRFIITVGRHNFISWRLYISSSFSILTHSHFTIQLPSHMFHLTLQLLTATFPMSLLTSSDISSFSLYPSNDSAGAFSNYVLSLCCSVDFSEGSFFHWHVSCFCCLHFSSLLCANKQVKHHCFVLTCVVVRWHVTDVPWYIMVPTHWPVLVSWIHVLFTHCVRASGDRSAWATVCYHCRELDLDRDLMWVDQQASLRHYSTESRSGTVEGTCLAQRNFSNCSVKICPAIYFIHYYKTKCVPAGTRLPAPWAFKLQSIPCHLRAELH